jgi:hypothetical protein
MFEEAAIARKESLSSVPASPQVLPVGERRDSVLQQGHAVGIVYRNLSWGN